MDWNPSDVISVDCIASTDPKYVRVTVLSGAPNPIPMSYEIPYTFYQIIQQPLGLPDIIC